MWTRFTPSRVPLVDQRWTVLPPHVPPTPTASARVSRSVADRPAFQLQPHRRRRLVGRVLPRQQLSAEHRRHRPVVPGDAGDRRRRGRAGALGDDRRRKRRTLPPRRRPPTSTCSTSSSLECQTGESVFVDGYAGEAITNRRSTMAVTFAPDRGLTKSIVGRASSTIDVNRSFAIESAVRTTGGGEYARVEYSRASGAALARDNRRRRNRPRERRFHRPVPPQLSRDRRAPL